MTPAYSPPSAVCVSVAVSSDPSASSPAFTVTVCAVFQVEAVKVSVFVALRPVSVRSVLAWPETVTVTVSEGCAPSLTV